MWLMKIDDTCCWNHPKLFYNLLQSPKKEQTTVASPSIQVGSLQLLPLDTDVQLNRSWQDFRQRYPLFPFFSCRMLENAWPLAISMGNYQLPLKWLWLKMRPTESYHEELADLGGLAWQSSHPCFPWMFPKKISNYWGTMAMETPHNPTMYWFCWAENVKCWRSLVLQFEHTVITFEPSM